MGCGSMTGCHLQGDLPPMGCGSIEGSREEAVAEEVNRVHDCCIQKEMGPLSLGNPRWEIGSQSRRIHPVSIGKGVCG